MISLLIYIRSMPDIYMDVDAATVFKNPSIEILPHEREGFEYVINALQRGFEGEKIRSNMAKVGWNEETVEKFFRAAKEP